MKKPLYIIAFILLIVSASYAIYNYQNPNVLTLNGSYQGIVFNENEEEVGIYTLNIEDEKVTLFSTKFNESYSGQIVDLDTDNYDLNFDKFKVPLEILSENEIQLVINNEFYIFQKKSDVSIWEIDG